MTDLPDFQLLFDALPTPCLALHPHTLTVVAANAAAQALLGANPLRPGQALAQLFDFDAATFSAWESALAAVQATGKTHSVVVQWRRPATAAATPFQPLQATFIPVRPAPEAPLRYVLCQLQEGPNPQPTLPLPDQPLVEQEQFRLLADFIPQLVWITNAAGRYEYFSSRWTSYTGQTLASADVPGLWRAMTHPDDQPLVRARWRHSLSTGEAYEMEHRFRAQDGSFRWFLSQALPHRNAAGAIVRWVGTSTDIDEQKRTHQLLEAKDQQLQQILSQVPAYIATLTGPDHVYRYVNERAQQLFRGKPG